MLHNDVSQQLAIKPGPTHGAVNGDRRRGGQPNRTTNEAGKSSYTNSIIPTVLSNAKHNATKTTKNVKIRKTEKIKNKK